MILICNIFMVSLLLTFCEHLSCYKVTEGLYGKTGASSNLELSYYQRWRNANK